MESFVVTGAQFAIAVSILTLLWSVGWSIWLYRTTHHPKLRVTACLTLAATHDDTIENLISVAIANTGSLPVTITSLAFRIVGDRKKQQLLPTVWLQPSVLPKPLEVGGYFQAPYSDREELRKTLADAFSRFDEDARWRIVAVASDAAGISYESKPVTI